MSRPKDVEYEWTAANNGNIGPLNYKQHRYYKFNTQTGDWWSWSPMFEVWRKSLNDDAWFTEQIIQGYFVAVK